MQNEEFNSGVRSFKSIECFNDLKKGCGIFTDKQDLKVTAFLTNDTIVVNPYFQRNYIWEEPKKSELIESIIVGFPIPSVYSYFDQDSNKQMIIDGQQRLTTLISYMNNEFPLIKGLRIRPELEGLKYKDLDEETKNNLNLSTIEIKNIANVTNSKIIFEIFRRFNTGSVNLKPQEIRNCIYNGIYNDWITEFSNYPDFYKTVFCNRNANRMEPQELVVKFFAFYFDIDKYKNNTNYFLDDHMANRSIYVESLCKEQQNKERNRLWNIFKKSIDISNLIFGEQAFKAFRLKLSEKNNQIVWSGSYSTYLYILLMLSFADYEVREIIEYSDAIKEAFINLLLNNKKLEPSKYSMNKTNLLYSLKTWRLELQQIIGIKKNTRSFSYKLKYNLWKTDPTCTQCGQNINKVDDAQIDHHKPYWRGGETIPENARLMHRFCNQSKGGR